MNAQQLKNSILQLAIQGKLVEQRPEEGTAKELLQEISAEKRRLIREGKIKKAKPLPEISEDEIPFEVPESWEWVRIGFVFYLQAGKNIPTSDIQENKSEEYIYPCYGGNGIRGYVSKFNREGDYPLIGRQGALCGNINLASGKFYATEHAVVAETFCGTDIKWAGLFLKALNLNQYATATAQPGLAVRNINQVLIPLPPLAEQHRIVSKIEELLPYIDQYDKAYTKLTAWNKKFPEAIKQSILQYAMEGKLVEQRPEEGTAEELLREIRAEKARLVKEGKIKKTKPLPEISEDEIPFEVPESWMWVRVGEIFYLQAGKSLPSSEIRESKENEYMHPCYGGNGLRGYVSQFNREGFYPLIGRQGALCGNINLATGKFYATEHAVVTETFSGTDIKWTGMFLKALNLNQYATATAQPGLAVKNLNSVLIPLPPVKEQKRIVDRVEELFCIICNERALR